MALPRIAITMGDAAGVGPEVIMKALAHPEVHVQCRPLVVGDARRLARAGVDRRLGARDPHHRRGRRRALRDRRRRLPGPRPRARGRPFGELSKACGEAAYRFIERAVALALAGDVEAICTAPINKEALNAAGHRFPGHTEILAQLTGTAEVSLMLMAPGLRVIHVTTHIGLLDAIDRIDAGLVERTISRGRDLLRRAGTAEPRIAICGINPHAGEGGLFGRGEEETKIVPAVRACTARGWRVEGPLPADTLFYRARKGDFDLVVAMYHDQGHGPVKAVAFDTGVNVTAGLPVVRTSVDHGTAFDIAGTGKADERSMLEALRQAAALAPR